MHFLVLGANGMAGHMIALYLKEQGHTVVGFANTTCRVCDSIIGDALDRDSVKSALATMDFDVVVNCIGVLNNEVNKDMARGIYINSLFPHLLAELLKDSKTRLIHISTDCVFLGNKGAYREDSVTDAESIYGKTKALGEINDDKNLTIRTSIVGPELKQDGIGLFHWFMNQTEFANGFTEAIWTGVTTLQLAKAIEAASIQNVIGLYQLVNNTTISKYELLCLFNKYCKNNKTVIHKNSSFFSDKSLVNTRTDFDFNVPSYEQMIVDMSGWIKSHGKIYTQYIHDII